MFNHIKNDSEVRMKKCVEIFKNYLNKIRVGRISPDMLNDIKIDYYGVLTCLHHMSTIVIENPHTLVITMFDNKFLSMVEKAIIDSDLGCYPVSDGVIIRVSIPPLTRERRTYLIKVIRSEAEKGRISLRNIRRFSNEKIKSLFKRRMINEDEEHVFQDSIQKLTNIWIRTLDKILIKKEEELVNSNI